MALPTVNVEIDGKVVQRTRVLRTLLSKDGGSIACTQPLLLDGEKLIERPGQIPMIVKEPDVKADRIQHDMYRDHMVRSVLGTAPAILAKAANPVALDCMAHRLVDAENAKALLRANGCGRHTDSLADMVRVLIAGRAPQAA